MKKSLILSLLMISSFCFGSVEKNGWSALTADQQKSLYEGKQVLIAEKIPERPWPCFHVYSLLAATPLQAAAVFWDAEYEPYFIPHCIKAVVDARPSLNVAEVDYELQMPIFSNEISKVRNELKALPNDGGYEISWEILHSKYSKSGRGSFLVVPHDQGSLICYNNFVDPASIIAPLLRTQAEKQVRETVSAIVAQIAHETKEEPELLVKQEMQLKLALGE